MKLYTLFSRLKYPKTYLGKILLVAFLGTHVPLIVLLFVCLFFSQINFGVARIVIVSALIATLLTTLVTLYVLRALLEPVSVASRALHQYLEDEQKPDLPTGFGDQAGRLMADVQNTVDRLDDLIRSLHERSVRDPLTGAYNRRACEEQLAEEVAKVHLGEGTLTLAILDTDGLKPINDRYGHAAGDACLLHVAETIQRNLRRGDWLARWGGDEFVVVLWDAEDTFSAERVLDRAREHLMENPVRLPQGGEERLTFSAGVICYTQHGDGVEAFEEVVEELIDRADESLYQAKRTGRNRIVYSTSGG